MPRGSSPGERRGGRQKGSGNKKTREIAEKAAESGITPLEVMIEAMRFHHRRAQKANDEKKGEHLKEAATMAEKAAPYMHPRLAAVEHTGKGGKDLIPQYTDEERAIRLHAILQAGAAKTG